MRQSQCQFGTHIDRQYVVEAIKFKALVLIQKISLLKKEKPGCYIKRQNFNTLLFLFDVIKALFFYFYTQTKLKKKV